MPPKGKKAAAAPKAEAAAAAPAAETKAVAAPVAAAPAAAAAAPAEKKATPAAAAPVVAAAAPAASEENDDEEEVVPVATDDTTKADEKVVPAGPTPAEIVAKLVKQTNAAKISEANRLKESGSKLFAANDFKGAALKFTDAITCDPTNEVLYSNRSACYLALGKSDFRMVDAAIADGRICVELKPSWGKGYARLGAALLVARDFAEAARIYTIGAAKEPTNALLAEGLASAQKSLKAKREADEEDEKRGHVIGIDLGTTFSCVGVWMGEKVVMIPNDLGQITTPSYVAFSNHGKRTVGMAAKTQAAKNPRNTIYDVKRFIGQRFSDPGVSTDCGHYAFPVKAGADDKPTIEVDMGMHGKKTFAAEEISAMVLAYLKQSAEKFLKQPVTKAVITVPAYFNDAQRNATKAAGRIAGLDVMRIINEPTAAALSYGLDLKTQGKGRKVNVLIFDLGGGTFDVSLLSIENGVFEVKATGGDTRLGGEDFDLVLMRAMQREAEAQGIPDFNGDQRAIKRLTVACEQAKRTLSTAQTAEIVVDAIVVPKKAEGKAGTAELKDSYDFKYTLERAKFEKLCEPFFVRCLETVKKVLKDAKAKPEIVDDIVLVGGSTRIPKMQEMLQTFFSGKELCRSLNPDEAVAYGAAVQGAILNGKRTKQTDNLLLMDVTPLSLGIETEGRVMSIIIPRNTSIPVVRTQTYTTTENYQTQVDVSVYEGERMKSDANNLLGKFTISGIERAKKGEAKVDVSFALDSNGILNVEAKDQKTGAHAKIEIASRGRSSDEDIERMVKDAEKFRREDESRLKKVEAVNELEGLINSIHDLILEDPTLGATVETAAADAQSWLEENGETASAADVNAKRRTLQTILAREQTRGTRPGGRKQKK